MEDMEKVEGETQTEETPTEETLEPQDEAARLNSLLQTMEENWKNEQRVSSKKEQDIQQLKREIDSLRSDKELSQSLIAMLANQQGKSEEEVTEEISSKKPNLLSQYQALQNTQEATRRVRQLQQRTDALGLDPQSEDYLDIRDWAQAGRYDRAEARLSKLEKAKKETPKETEEERITRLAEERVKKIAEEKGLLTTDTSGPSGGAGKSYRLSDLPSFWGPKKRAATKDLLKALEDGRVMNA